MPPQQPYPYSLLPPQVQARSGADLVSSACVLGSPDVSLSVGGWFVGGCVHHCIQFAQRDSHVLASGTLPALPAPPGTRVPLCRPQWPWGQQEASGQAGVTSDPSFHRGCVPQSPLRLHGNPYPVTRSRPQYGSGEPAQGNGASPVGTASPEPCRSPPLLLAPVVAARRGHLGLAL